MRSLLTLLLLLIALGGGSYLLWRYRRQANHVRRKRAWQARRDEEDRIWYDQHGGD